MSTDAEISKINSGLRTKKGKKIALFVAAFLILGCVETKYRNNIIIEIYWKIIVINDIL